MCAGTASAKRYRTFAKRQIPRCAESSAFFGAAVPAAVISGDNSTGAVGRIEKGVFTMLSFTLAVLFLIITPGPAVLTAAGFGASYGFRRSIGYVIGLLVGANLIMLLVITGLSAIVLSAPWLRFVLVTISLLFLIYLASKIAFAGSRIAFIRAERPPGFWSGVLIQTVNPKAYAVMTSLFTGFNYAPNAFVFEVATKILIANALWLPIHLLWLWAGVQLHALDLSARVQRLINFAMAGALLAVVVLSGLSLLSPAT